MQRTLNQVVVEQSAPTLAGVKPASLFRYLPLEGHCGAEEVAQLREELASFGLVLRVMKICRRTGAYILYLYRPDWLERILADADNRAFLNAQGYGPEDGVEALLRELSGRLCLDQEFPHEIGVFLGYPLVDVVGFIENHGANYTCRGPWKSYGDPVAAEKCFDCFHRCTRNYVARFQRGAKLEQLVVPAAA